MFYCDKCAAKNGYPQSISKSHGPCELCRKTALCNDVPSSAISRTKAHKTKNGN